MYDFLIVGAGFSGAVLAERLANVLGKRVLILDKRNHIGGNAHDYYNDIGILVHKYGPHWFHTNSPEVFEYLSRFTKWRPHFHRVRSFVDGRLVPIPINMDTLNMLYNLGLSSPNEVQQYFDTVKTKIEHPSNAEEAVTSLVGVDLYEKFFKNYTIKQWSTEPRLLAASVTARIPVRTNRDDRYFTDKYQVMPLHGYHKLFENILSSKKIHVMLNTDYREVVGQITFNKMIYTGAIDEYFDFEFGKLKYRTLDFEHENINSMQFQPYQQINYPNDYEFTRIVEWKHATGQIHPLTTITREYSRFAEDTDEKYYPIPMEETRILYEKYYKLTQKHQSTVFVGRLAEYKYYNMDQVVARAFKVFKDISDGNL